MHFSICVFQIHAGHSPVIDRRQMYTASVHKASAECQPFRRIMVAADDKYLQLPLGQTVQKIVKKLHCLRTRHRFVINVSGDQNAVRIFLIDDVDHFCQYVFLILQHGIFIDPFSQMKIRQMDEFHRIPLLRPFFL